MSIFERDGYQWRETYFVFFEAARRPSLAQIEKVLHKLSKRFELAGGMADEAGQFEAISLVSEIDYAAIDIAYEQGEEVLEQADLLAKEMKSPHLDATERKRVERLAKLDGRFDLLHFEHVSAEDSEDDEMLDPSALLLVLDALVDLTKGVGVDPASGTLV
jgi:hypothetical protein